MSANRTEPGSRPEGRPAEKSADLAAPTAAPQSAGLQAWLPIIAAIVAMPLLAYVITTFILVPKLQHSLGYAPKAAESSAKTEPAAGSHAAAAGGHGGSSGQAAQAPAGREQVPFPKLLVNVAGTMGTRLLMTSLTLVSNSSDFKARVTRNEAQLRDTACGILSTKSIADLEKPGARNILRSELIAAFNNVFGDAVVQEVYFSEFAIQ
jgi:flagellar FliL protein